MEDKLKVLVVDDDRRMVRTISDILRVKGYETAVAFSGEEAVEQVRVEEPHCVLMDIKMPGIDGVEALKRIRAQAPELPVVLMSAFATEEQAEEARRNGACAVLTKPIDFQQVLSFLSILRREESILVVDDDPAFTRTLRDILQARGYRVEMATDPGRALGNLEQGDSSLVLLDLRLGTASGLDVLREIRAKKPGIPVVLLTGYRDEISAIIRNGLEAGAYTCLFKPFAMDDLIGAISNIRRQERQEALGEGS